MIGRLCIKYLRARGMTVSPARPADDYLYDEDNIRTPRNHDFVDDPRFIAAREAQASTPYAGNGGLHGRWNLHVLLWAAARAVAAKTDIVQLGVFEGGEALAMATYAGMTEPMKSRMILVDTFTGIPEGQWTAAEIAAGADSAQHIYKASGDGYADVCQRMTRFGKNVEVIQGAVPAALSKIKSKKIGLLIVDMNCAAPELAALEYLWDRVVPGGVVISDDYGHSRPGHGFYEQKKTFDAFGVSKGAEVLSLPMGYGIIVK